MGKTLDENNVAKDCMPTVLRRHRDALGLSQQQLADIVGIAKSYVSALELGYRAPNLNLLVKLAAAFDMRPGQLVDEMMEEAFKKHRPLGRTKATR